VLTKFAAGITLLNNVQQSCGSYELVGTDTAILDCFIVIISLGIFEESEGS
jgi:hypothetical protein